MASLTEYLEGTVKVPLSLLTSDGFAECPTGFSDRATVSDFTQFLHNSDQPITGIVTPKTLQDMLQALGKTHAQFRQTLGQDAESLPNNVYNIDCLLGQQCLDKAKAALGAGFKCTVRIYSIPPDVPGKYSEGEICRNLLRCSESTDSNAFNVWLARLPPGKQRHMVMLMHRHEIWAAMQAVVPFSGHWGDSIQIGNIAKHLAAHCDDIIVRYWRHIYTVWSKIFVGLENKTHLLDTETVRFLQYKAPGWSKTDRDDIILALEAGILFRDISKDLRGTLYTNLCSLRVVIPSILTFNENLRYLTIGLKILERHIVVKPPKQHRKARSKAYILEPPDSIYKNLEADWNRNQAYVDGGVQVSKVEVSEGKFWTASQPPSARYAFIGLLLLSTRDFPCLCSDPPYQDIKGVGINAYLRPYYLKRLFKTAAEFGFQNAKIRKGLASPDVPKETLELPKGRLEVLEDSLGPGELMMLPSGWRGGKPSIRTFTKLQSIAFLPDLFKDHPPSTEPTLQAIMGDLIRAFFGEFTVNLTAVHITAPTYTVPVLPDTTELRDVLMQEPVDHNPRPAMKKVTAPLGPRGKGKLRGLTQSKLPKIVKESQISRDPRRTKASRENLQKRDPTFRAAREFWVEENPVGLDLINEQPPPRIPALQQRIFSPPPPDNPTSPLNPTETSLNTALPRPAASEVPPGSKRVRQSPLEELNIRPQEPEPENTRLKKKQKVMPSEGNDQVPYADLYLQIVEGLRPTIEEDSISPPGNETTHPDAPEGPRNLTGTRPQQGVDVSTLNAHSEQPLQDENSDVTDHYTAEAGLFSHEDGDGDWDGDGDEDGDWDGDGDANGDIDMDRGDRIPPTKRRPPPPQPLRPSSAQSVIS